MHFSLSTLAGVIRGDQERILADIRTWILQVWANTLRTMRHRMGSPKLEGMRASQGVREKRARRANVAARIGSRSKSSRLRLLYSAPERIPQPYPVRNGKLSVRQHSHRGCIRHDRRSSWEGLVCPSGGKPYEVLHGSRSGHRYENGSHGLIRRVSSERMTRLKVEL